jgi:UDP-glucuronate 4-epimerase
MEMITTLEACMGKEAIKNLLPMQPGDVYQTYADTQDLFKAINFTPKVSVKQGIQAFVDWYKAYYKI